MFWKAGKADDGIAKSRCFDKTAGGCEGLVHPGAVLAPTQRGGIKHHAQVVSVLRHRINLWPGFPFQDSEPRAKFKQRKLGSFAAKEREAIKAVQDGALPKACKLLQAEQKEEVDAETIAAEMRRLHPGGVMSEW